MAIGTGLLLAGASLASGAISAGAAGDAADAASASADQATELQRDIYDQTTENYAPFLDAGTNGLAAYLYEMGLGPRPMTGGTAPGIESFTTTTGGTPGVTTGGGFGGPQTSGGTPGTETTRYRVGEQEFSTMAEAEQWANENRTGGTEYGGYSVSPMARYLLEEGQQGIQGAAAAGGGLYSGATLQALEDDRRRLITADTGDYFSRLLGLTNMGMAAAGNQAGAGQNYANSAGNIAMQNGQAQGNAAIAQGQAWGNTLGDMAGIYGYFQNNPMAAYASPTMTSSRIPVSNPLY